jgi:alpha-glucoside transport system permease protein
MGDLATSIPLLIVIGAVGIPVAVYLMLGLGDRLAGLLPARMGKRIRPWVWLFLPVALVVLILVYPLVSTIAVSFLDAAQGASFGNYIWAFKGAMLKVLQNNLTWLVVFPVATLLLALLAAVLFDRVKYERLAVTVIVLPTAISFSAGSVIWTRMYQYRPPGSSQTGLLNALWTLVPGAEPVAWLQTPVVNNLALIVVAVWLSLGVATLILSAAVKNVAPELAEAARIDGASEWRIFRSITLPSIRPAVLVVLTTQVIAALKVFDIIYVTTNGNYQTDVIANRMFNELFQGRSPGHASAIAVILLVVAMPVVVLNVAQFRREVGS